MHFRFLHVPPWLDSFLLFLICSSLVFDLDSSTGMNLEECIVHLVSDLSLFSAYFASTYYFPFLDGDMLLFLSLPSSLGVAQE